MEVDLSKDGFDKDRVGALQRAVDLQHNVQLKSDENSMRAKQIDDLEPVLKRIQDDARAKREAAELKDITPDASA